MTFALAATFPLGALSIILRRGFQPGSQFNPYFQYFQEV
jgi:hypothetical protein